MAPFLLLILFSIALLIQLTFLRTPCVILHVRHPVARAVITQKILRKMLLLVYDDEDDVDVAQTLRVCARRPWKRAHTETCILFLFTLYPPPRSTIFV